MRTIAIPVLGITARIVLVLSGTVRGAAAVALAASLLASSAAEYVIRRSRGKHRPGEGSHHLRAAGRAGQRPGRAGLPVAGTGTGTAARPGLIAAWRAALDAAGAAYRDLAAACAAHDRQLGELAQASRDAMAASARASAQAAAMLGCIQASYPARSWTAHAQGGAGGTSSGSPGGSGASSGIVTGAGGSGSSIQFTGAGGNAGSAGGAGGAGGGSGSSFYGQRSYPLQAGGVLGMHGFSEREGVPDRGTAAGYVTGYRWWSLTAPDLSRSPADADLDWPPGLLRGTREDWQPGPNHARCLNASYRGHPEDGIPDSQCGCGFWAYWELQHHDLGSGAGRLPVCGVIRGYGRTRIGDLGFRCATARIVAVHLPFTIMAQEEAAGATRSWLDHGHAHQYGAHNPWYNHPKFTGRVINYGLPQVPPQALPQACPELTPEGAGRRAAELRDAAAQAEAWIAVIGDRIEQVYPGVRVFEALNAMRAAFPPDPVYVKRYECPACGNTVTENDLDNHVTACRGLAWNP